MKILTLVVINEGTEKEEVVCTNHNINPAEGLMYFQRLLIAAERDQAKKELMEGLKKDGKLQEKPEGTDQQV